MELKVDIGFEALMDAIKQLPVAKLNQVKAELSENAWSKVRENSNDFQHILLSGPVMDDKQYEDYKEMRSRLNKWRTKK